MRLHQVAAVVLACCFAALGPSWGQDKSDEKKSSTDASKSIAAVRKHIDEKGGKGAGEIKAKDEAVVRATFPAYDIINARFRQFPVARILPDGMSASNLFAVDKDGKIEHLKDAKALQKFFQARQAPVKTDKDAKTLLAAWLTLSQEFHQDGMFKFEVLVREFAFEDNKATGRATVMQGGNGQLSAELLIDKNGKLAKATEKVGIRAGPRPICQATKLLDADPVVRRIAEQDLLIMGLAARDYLLEQRERATPELRQAIDRLWQQIQKNGW